MKKLINPNLPNVTEYDDRFDKSAAEEVKKAASQGDVAALYELACRYRNGIDGVEKDPVKSLQLFMEVLKYQNNRRAFYHIGFLLSDGVLGEDRKCECLNYYKAACDMGDSRAAVQLAILYENGIDVKQNFDRALAYYDKAIQFGNGNGTERVYKAQLYEKLGKEDLARQCYEEALQFFDNEIIKVPEEELPWCWGMKGNIYRYLKRYKSAKNCYEKALSYGDNAEAATMLGTLYEDGVPGVIKIDNKKAYEYYVKGYETKLDDYQGVLNTKMLALFLFNGKAGEGNEYRAFQLFSEIRDSGYKEGNVYLGFYYGVGIPGHVSVDTDLAFRLLDDVVESDKTDALYYKGAICYATLKDIKKAKEYLSQAASQGDEDAKALLDTINKEFKEVSGSKGPAGSSTTKGPAGSSTTKGPARRSSTKSPRTGSKRRKGAKTNTPPRVANKKDYSKDENDWIWFWVVVFIIIIIIAF